MKGNSVSIVGTVTRDVETRRAGESNIAKWGIAWNSSKRDANGNWVDKGHFFDVECWASDKQLAVIEDSIAKGAKCAIVDGHLEFDSWESKDGQKRSKVTIKVDDPINGLVLSTRKARATDATPDEQYSEASVYDSSDIPF